MYKYLQDSYTHADLLIIDFNGLPNNHETFDFQM